MRPLRGVAVGMGYFSAFHLDAWSRLDDVEIVAVCDIREDAARRSADRFDIASIYSTLEEMLDAESPDFVDVITRPETHWDCVGQAARRGIAVICQKPLAPTFDEARRLVDMAEDSGVRLMVHENFRFQPWYREVRRLLEQGVVGSRLHSIAFRMRTGDGHGSDAYLERQPYFRDMPRFLVHETGVHWIDTFRFLGGEIERVDAQLRRLNPAIAGEDAAHLTMRFANGAIGTWDANRYNESASVSDPRYTFGTMVVEADGGTIRLDEDGRLFVARLGEAEQQHDYPHERRAFAGDCVYFTQRHFVDRLRDEQAFETNGRDYLETLRLVEEVYHSAGEVIDVGKISTSRSSSQNVPTALRRLIDLSQPLENGVRGVDVSPATTIDDVGWNSTTLSLYSHCGTHMDAPKHFLGNDGASIDKQALNVCMGPAKVVDLTPVDPRELLTVDRVLAAVGAVEAGDRLLLRTDWSSRLGTPAYRDDLPRIGVELAKWLVEKQVALVGVEAPSVADVNDLAEVTAVHQTLFRGGVVIIEGLVNLNQLTRSVVEFLAFPLRVTDGDGSPVRAVAIE